MKDNRHLAKKALQQAALKAINLACMKVKSDAQLLVPVDVGDLKRSIEYEVEQNSKQVEGQIGSNKDYAVFVEFGTGEFAENGNGRKGGWRYQDNEGKWHFTKGQKPQPFLRPAYKQNKKNIKNIIEKELKGVSF
ncbi:HK97 gp10 family phage protein [Aerococcaceae bacterium NML160702]|nr:HK97 gp10 family phage protein [Aerococcaceae bacterium NML160702]